MNIVPPSAPFIQWLKDTPAFFLVPHSEPDGDCVGSALGLASFLRRIGKRAYLHSMGPFEKADVKRYEALFQQRITRELRNAEPDAGVIILDCSNIDRIGILAEDIQGMTIAVIDHHSAGREFGDYRYINSDSPATSILIQALIESWGETLNKDEAEYLFLAFCTDTGFFRHLESRHAPVFSYVERMVDAGASPKEMFLFLNSNASFMGRQHLGKLLARTESFASGQLLVCYELFDETQAVGKQNRESDLLYQMLMGIAGVEVVIMLREEKLDFITAGLRSKKSVDVGKVALQFGGGGHARAAGFGAQGLLADVRKRAIEIILSLL